jgi:Uma2 family endonuclease
MNEPLTRARIDLPHRAFSVEEVRRMVEAGIIPEDERLEIIHGWVVPMSPKGARHETIKAAIVRRWRKTCPDDYDFVPETGLYLDADTYLEPDFVVYRANVSIAGLIGSDVLLAIEVADSSLARDLRVKPAVFARYGVAELWVIDVPGQKVHVHREPTTEGYRRVTEHGWNEKLVPEVAPSDLGFSVAELERR